MGLFANKTLTDLRSHLHFQNVRNFPYTTQMGLAMKSGRSLRCIQYLEAGTQEPTLSTLYAIAHALDLRVMDLIEALPEELNDMYN